jgi:hypothetical protein
VSIFELMMLICFGVSWPISVLKSIRTKSTAGKSLLFMIIILIGYVFGILHKILYSFDFVIYAYIFNFIMVSIDIILYFYNRSLEKKASL